jgi:ABC-type branched-subunit amino acid transport system permease subunit
MTRFGELQKNLLCALLFFVLMATLPLVITQRYLLGEVITFMLWTSVALQWNVLMGHAGVFSLGQMVFFVCGSYTVAMLGTYLGVSPWLSIPLGAIVAAVAALVIGIACLRLAPAYVALLTFAIGYMIYTLINSESECYITTGGNCLTFWGGSNGFAQFPDFGFRPWLKGNWLLGNYFMVLVSFIISLVASIVIIHGRFGLAFRAMSDSAIYAASRGISRTKFQIVAFVITAFFTGMTGGVHATHFRYTGTSLLELSTTVFILSMVIVGGLKSTWGPVLGGVLMTVLVEVAKNFGDVRNTLLGFVLVCFVLLLPKGVAGAGSSILAALGRREKVQDTVGEEHAGQAQNA